MRLFLLRAVELSGVMGWSAEVVSALQASGMCPAKPHQKHNCAKHLRGLPYDELACLHLPALVDDTDNDAPCCDLGDASTCFEMPSIVMQLRSRVLRSCCRNSPASSCCLISCKWPTLFACNVCNVAMMLSQSICLGITMVKARMFFCCICCTQPINQQNCVLIPSIWTLCCQATLGIYYKLFLSSSRL